MSHYGAWALAGNSTSPVKLWRVESEKFAIQLTAAQKQVAKLAKLMRDKEELGTKTIIYIAFQPPQNCSFE